MLLVQIRTSLFVACIAVLLLLVDLSPAGAAVIPTAPSFTPIPLISSGVAEAVSADGSTVVGRTSGVGKAFRWTAAGGTEFLGGSSWSGAATDVSGDGSVVIGKNASTTGNIVGDFRWTSAGGFVPLNPIPRSESNGASGVSTDGSVIVGTRTVGNILADGYEEPYRWTQASGMVPLPSLPGAAGVQRAAASAVSDQGTVVGASSDNPYSSPYIAVRWNADGTISRLFDQQPGFSSGAIDITPDGSVIVGYVSGGAFRWTETGGVQLLSGYGNYGTRVASGISADGSVIVGEAQNSSGFDAFIWDPVHGTRSLKAVLMGLGVDLGGWNLTEAYGVSHDGLTIAGYGVAPGATQFQPWVATIPEPAAMAAVLLLSLFGVRRRRTD